MTILIVNWTKISKRKVEEEGDIQSVERNHAERSGKLEMWKGFGQELIIGDFEKIALVKWKKKEISLQVQNNSMVRSWSP